MTAVRDLRPGMPVDLEGDPYADGPCSVEQTTGEPCYQRGPHGESRWAYEYAEVHEVRVETPECWLVTTTTDDVVGFPPDHQVKLPEVPVTLTRECWTVVDEQASPPSVLGRFPDHDSAAVFIGALPDHEAGRYALDGPPED